MQRIARLRDLMLAEGLDGVVLTHPHDVLYTTGYRSVLERWGQQEPLAAVVVPCSDDRLVFCEVSRAADPYAKASSLGAEFVRHYGERVRDSCEPDVIASIAAALRDHGLAGTRLDHCDRSERRPPQPLSANTPRPWIRPASRSAIASLICSSS